MGSRGALFSGLRTAAFLVFGLASLPASAGQQVTYAPGTFFPEFEPTYQSLTNPQNWSYELGGGVGVAPRYEGSDRMELKAFPMVNIMYQRGLFFAGTQGIGSSFLRGDNYHLSAGLGYDIGRDEDDDKTNLRGLGDVDPSVLAFLDGEYSFGLLFVGADAKTGLGGDYGSTISMDVGAKRRFVSGVTLKGDLHTQWADSEHMDHFFGVSAAQAARSGKRRFDAGSGIESFGLGLSLAYELTKTWTLNGRANADLLSGDASDSPISADDFQPSGYVGLSYRF